MHEESLQNCIVRNRTRYPKSIDVGSVDSIAHPDDLQMYLLIDSGIDPATANITDHNYINNGVTSVPWV